MGLGDRYELLAPLGSGAFGEVWWARYHGEAGFTREVAVKRLRAQACGDPELETRLRDEARILGLLTHRALPQVERLTRVAGRWAVVMEYVRGWDIAELLREGPLPERAAWEVVVDVAGALRAGLETQGVDGQPLALVHRDLKPSNLRLTPDGQVKVLDFGAARAHFAEREAHTRSLTFGSPGYMAPERWEFRGGPASDIYSLGVVLFEMLSGERLGKTSASRARHEQFVQPGLERLRARDELSPLSMALLEACLAWAPEQRPTASALEKHSLRGLDRLTGPSLRVWLGDRAPPMPPEVDSVTGLLMDDGPAQAGPTLPPEDWPSTQRAPARARAWGPRLRLLVALCLTSVLVGPMPVPSAPTHAAQAPVAINPDLKLPWVPPRPGPGEAIVSPADPPRSEDEGPIKGLEPGSLASSMWATAPQETKPESSDEATEPEAPLHIQGQPPSPPTPEEGPSPIVSARGAEAAWLLEPSGARLRLPRVVQPGDYQVLALFTGVGEVPAGRVRLPACGSVTLSCDPETQRCHADGP